MKWAKKLRSLWNVWQPRKPNTRKTLIRGLYNNCLRKVFCSIQVSAPKVTEKFNNIQLAQEILTLGMGCSPQEFEVLSLLIRQGLRPWHHSLSRWSGLRSHKTILLYLQLTKTYLITVALNLAIISSNLCSQRDQSRSPRFNPSKNQPNNLIQSWHLVSPKRKSLSRWGVAICAIKTKIKVHIGIRTYHQ